MSSWWQSFILSWAVAVSVMPPAQTVTQSQTRGARVAEIDTGGNFLHGGEGTDNDAMRPTSTALVRTSSNASVAMIRKEKQRISADLGFSDTTDMKRSTLEKKVDDPQEQFRTQILSHLQDQVTNLDETCICPGEVGEESLCSDGVCPGQLMQRWCQDIGEHPLHGALNFSRVCPIASTFEAVDISLLDVAEADSAKLLVRSSEDDRQILDEVERAIEQYDEDHAFQLRDALGVFKEFASLSAKDILAFQETWTEADTDILRSLDNADDGFVENGSLTTSSFVVKLPKLSDLTALIGRHPSLAIVGSGASLENSSFGQDIDAHSAVVRFNGLVRHFLRWVDTGRRTTLHVFNAMVKPLEREAVTLNEVEGMFDLESNTPGRSYCSRMYKGGSFASYKKHPVYLIRPTVYCSLPKDVDGFTRGFMFYWFLGRLFPRRTMYGFSGNQHYNASRTNSSMKNPGIFLEHERFLQFEHLLYKYAEQADALKP